MMRTIPFFRSSIGLNTKVDPVRLQYDPENGVQPLAEAVNVDIDPTGRISRRRGLREIVDISAPHSLWATRDEAACFFIAGGGLYSLTIDGTTSLIKEGLAASTGYYCEVGHDIYFSNGTDLGVLKDRSVWEDWAATPYTGPETDRKFVGPSAGTHLFFYRGRLFYAIQNFLIYSEPFNYGCFDPARNFIPIPGGSILAAHPLEAGVFVSSDKGGYFLAGPEPAEFEFRTVLRFPAVPGSALVGVRAEQVLEGAQGEAVLFVAQQAGVCLCLGDGSVTELTSDRVDIPPASFGCAAMDRRHMQYITFLEV